MRHFRYSRLEHTVGIRSFIEYDYLDISQSTIAMRKMLHQYAIHDPGCYIFATLDYIIFALGVSMQLVFLSLDVPHGAVKCHIAYLVPGVCMFVWLNVMNVSNDLAGCWIFGCKYIYIYIYIVYMWQMSSVFIFIGLLFRKRLHFFLFTTIHRFKVVFLCFVAFAWRVEARNHW